MASLWIYISYRCVYILGGMAPLYIYISYRCIYILGGMAPPVDDWKKALDEMNSKSRQIEEDYEGTLVAKKVNMYIIVKTEIAIQ